MTAFDPRLTLARPGLAARELEGVMPAERYADTRALVCRAPSAAVRRDADPAAEQLDQLLFGEGFEVLEERDGYSFGQARRDGYVGWVTNEALKPPGARPTHRLAATSAFAYAAPDFKAPASGPYSLNSLVAVEARDGRFLRCEEAGWFAEEDLATIGEVFEQDLAAAAERFLGAPYLWGGRDALGLDCSGLVQQAAYACGVGSPRDTDMQERALGRDVAQSDLARGDLVFWAGHVGIMLDSERLLHANSRHMRVAVEALAEVDRRTGPPRRCARVTPLG